MEAIKHVSNALALLREPWEAETTVRNLGLFVKLGSEDKIQLNGQARLKSFEKRFEIKIPHDYFEMYGICVKYRYYQHDRRINED